jgi:hypothetical protein
MPVLKGYVGCSATFYILETPDENHTQIIDNGKDTAIRDQYAPGSTLTIPYLIGKLVQRPFYKNKRIDQFEIAYDKTTGTFTDTFADGDVFTIQFNEKL